MMCKRVFNDFKYRIGPAIGLLLLLLAYPLSAGSETPSGLPLLLETEWLAANRDYPRLRIVDFGRSQEEYQVGHIPGAVYLDRRATWNEVDGIVGMLPPVAEVVRALEEAGIGNDSTVLIYDSANGLWAARLFWALEYLGHRNVHLLNGGWGKWVQENRGVQTESPMLSKGSFRPLIQADLLATKKWLLDNLNNSGVTVVDTRSALEYNGEDLRAERGGHIPGAVNINWVLNITDDPDKTFLPRRELAELYDSQEVLKDRVVVTHCQTGVRGAHTYFTLRLLGYPKVRLYDGSWAEWGNALNTPVVSDIPASDSPPPKE